MALRPIDFGNSPPPRPSIIEQALGVGLSTLASRFVNKPFEKAEEKRREEAIVRGEQRAEVTAKAAERRGIENALELAKKKYEQDRSLSMANPVGNETRDLLESAFGYLNKPIDPNEVTTEQDLQEIVPILGAAIQGEASKRADARQRETRRDMASQRLDDLFKSVDYTKFMGKKVRDPDGKERFLTLEEMAAISNPGALAGLALSGDAATKTLVDRMKTSGQYAFENMITVAGQDPQQFAEFAQAISGPSQAAKSALDSYAQEALRLGLLRNPDGSVPKEGSQAEVSMRGNQDLLQAIAAANFYGDANRVMESERAGYAPLPASVKGYMQHIFQARGKPYKLGADVQNPEELGPVKGQAPGTGTNRAGGVQSDASRVAPRADGSTLPASLTNPVTGGAGRAPSTVDFAGSTSARLLYGKFSQRLSANPGDYRILSDSIAATHKDTKTAYEYWSKLPEAANSPLVADLRRGDTTALSRAKRGLQQLLDAAREARVGR